MNLSVQEQLIAIYAQFPGMKFDRANEGYNIFFYGVSKNPGSFFRGVRFDWDGPYPKSPDLDEAQEVLVAGHMVSSFTHENSPIILPICQHYYEEKIKGNLTLREIGELERIAGEFKKKLNVRDLFE